MAPTGRVVMWHTASVVGTSVDKVTDFALDSAGASIATAEDDDIYMSDQFTHDILVTGSITTRDADSWAAIETGTKGTTSIKGKDSDGATDHTFSITNSMVTGKPLTGPRGWSSYALNFQAVSADGATDPVSVS